MGIVFGLVGNANFNDDFGSVCESRLIKYSEGIPVFTRKAIEIVSFRSSFGVLRRIQASQPSFPPFWHFSDHS